MSKLRSLGFRRGRNTGKVCAHDVRIYTPSSFAYLRLIFVKRQKRAQGGMTKKRRRIRELAARLHRERERERLYGGHRQKLRRFFATVVSASAAFVSALLRAIKRLYRGPEFIRCAGYILHLKGSNWRDRVFTRVPRSLSSPHDVFPRLALLFFLLSVGRITTLRFSV